MYSHVASYPEHPFDAGTLIHTVVYIRHHDTLVRNCLDGTVRSEPCTKLYRVEVRVGGWTGSCRGLPSVRKRQRRRATWPWPPRMACCRSMEGLSHRVTPPRYARPPHVEAVSSPGWLEQVGGGLAGLEGLDTGTDMKLHHARAAPPMARAALGTMSRAEPLAARREMTRQLATNAVLCGRQRGCGERGRGRWRGKATKTAKGERLTTCRTLRGTAGVLPRTCARMQRWL
jgi:hypothetical protein